MPAAGRGARLLGDGEQPRRRARLRGLRTRRGPLRDRHRAGADLAGAAGRRLLLAVTGTRPDSPEVGAGALFEIPLVGRGARAGEPELFWRSRPFDGPDSFAIAGNPQTWAILDVWTGERGLPLHKPRIRPR